MISVIVPAFNAAATISETLESVAMQTVRPDEVIVIDDGSTDETASIAAGFKGRISSLRIISQANKGLSATRNVGIRASTGEFLAFLDADDIWHPTYLEKMVGRLRDRPDCGLVYSFLRRINLQSEIINESEPYGVDGWAPYQFIARNFVTSGSNAVFRRAPVLAAGGYEEGLSKGEDFFLILMVCWRMPITHVPEYLVGYRDTPGSMSKDLRRARESSVILRELLAQRIPDLTPTAKRWQMSVSTANRYLRLGRSGQLKLRDHLDMGQAALLDPYRWLHALFWRGSSLWRRQSRRPGSLSGIKFNSISPELHGKPDSNPALARRLAHAKKLDERHGRERVKMPATGA